MASGTRHPGTIPVGAPPVKQGDGFFAAPCDKLGKTLAMTIFKLSH